MTAIEVIAIIVVSIIIGFIVGYFGYLFKRYLVKKNAPKLIEKQNLKFRNCELQSFKGVFNQDDQGRKKEEITKQDGSTPGRTRQGKRNWGRAYQ